MKRRKLNRRGSIQDIVGVALIVFIVSIVVLVAYKTSYELNEVFQSDDKIDTHGKSSHQQITNLYSGVLDNSFLFMIVALSVGALILASLVRIHPVFIPVFIVAWLFIFVLTGVFSNAYKEMASNPEFVDLANNMYFMNLIMTSLPFIIGIFGALLAIVMYKAHRADAM